MKKVDAILCIADDRPEHFSQSLTSCISANQLIEFGGDLSIYGSVLFGAQRFHVLETGTIEVLYEGPFGEVIPYRVVVARIVAGTNELYTWFMPKELELFMGNVAHYRVLNESAPRAYKV